MEIVINPINYTFKINEPLEIKFNNSLNYAYLYGINSKVINSISIKDGLITFDALDKKGSYKDCYIGGYVESKWAQSNKFNITIEDVITPSKPDPEPAPTPVTSIKQSKNYNLLKLLNDEKKSICLLKNAKEIRVERELKSADEKLSFSYPLNNKFYKDIIEESYIRTKENEYIIKEIHELDDWTEFTCVLNVEDLEGKAWDRFESIENSIVDALNLALVGTGWTVGHNNVSKKRTVRKTNCSSWDIVQDIKKTYMVDMQFDCINKKINIYEHFGNDKGVYFMDSLNIKKLETQRDSYDFFTRLIPIGKDGLNIKDINSGKDYVENYQYSKKIKTLIWKDERYTVTENLKTDAEAKLNDLSKPRRAYRVDVINLSKISKDKYSILDYSLGDTITLISKDKNVREKQRIVKTTEYLQDHNKDSVEIANTILTFEEMQQDLQEAAETIDNITTDNGTVNGSCVDGLETKQISDFKEGVNKVVDLKVINADIDYLKVKKADIQDLNVVREKVGTLEATTINTTQFHALIGEIDHFKSTVATITDLTVTNEKVKVIEGETANFKTLLNGNLTSENIHSLNITSDKFTMENGFIKDAMVESLSFDKIIGNEINTNRFKITSKSGNLLIQDDTIQINDNKKTRVQIGKDASNNYGVYVWDTIGNLMFSSDKGLMEHGIKNKIIRDDMISDNANIQAYKLDINSVFKEMNNNSNTLNATRIKIDSENQTLDMAFSKLKTSTEDNKKVVESALTEITSQQGQIKATIEESKIIKDTQKTLQDKQESLNTTMQDNYNRTTATITSLQNTIGEHKSMFDSTDKKIKDVSVKTNTLKKDLESMSQEIQNTKESISKDKKDVDTQLSTIKQSSNKILAELNQTKVNVNKQIINVEKNILNMEMYSTKSTVKTDNTYSTTLHVKLLCKGIDITEENINKLKWIRISQDTLSDNQWNSKNHMGSSLKISQNDMIGSTEFKCILLS